MANQLPLNAHAVMRSAILTYHSLDRGGSVLSTAPETFRLQMDSLKEAGIAVLPLNDVQSNPGAVALTFDDGFGNFTEHALPVLRKHSFPATVFVVTDYVGQWNDWPTQPVSGVCRMSMMSWSELRTLPGEGIALGAHTRTHPNLCKLSAEEADREMRGSREIIEQKTGEPCKLFSYPYGGSNPAARAIAGNLFRIACGTRLDYVRPKSDPLELPRLDSYYLGGFFPVAKLMHAQGRSYFRLRRAFREVRSCFCP